MTLTVGSLASGYGGLEMALSIWLGAIDARWHAETDPGAARVLKTWWPDVLNVGDLTAPDFWERAERVDLMCGGIPCQPFSAAGRQQGEADERHLWPFWRAGIESHRPATIVFENVANLTRGKMRPIFDGIVADLLALGYDVRWCLLGACAVGAAHHRHRVFLLACRSRTVPNVRQVTVQTCGQGGSTYIPTPQHRDGENGRMRSQSVARGRLDSGRRNLDDAVATLLPTTTARDASTRGEGSPEFWEAKRATGWTGGVPLGAALSLLPSPRAIDATRGPAAADRVRPGGNGKDLPQVLVGLNLLPSSRGTDGSNRWGQYADAIARHAAVLGRDAPEPTEVGPRGGRRLAAAFSEWLMMLPAGHLTSVLDRNDALGRAGNGVVPLQAATALRPLFEDLTTTRRIV